MELLEEDRIGHDERREFFRAIVFNGRPIRLHSVYKLKGPKEEIAFVYRITRSSGGEWRKGIKCDSVAAPYRASHHFLSATFIIRLTLRVD